MTHEHQFSRYFLVDRNDQTYKFWNPNVLIHQLGAWYVGYECRCGAQGYAV